MVVFYEDYQTETVFVGYLISILTDWISLIAL